MAAALHMEIESFIGKFAFLSSCGFAADLHLTTENRQVKVNLQASLGSPSASTRCTKPSKIRRRQRRQANRINSRNASFTETERASSNDASVLDQLVANVDLTSNVTDLITSTQDEPTSALGSVDEVATSTFNQCKRDAAVQAVVTVCDSMSETDPAPNLTDTTPHRLQYLHDHQASFSMTNSEVQDCSCNYCDKEFTNWDEFLKHMKYFKYMCNNCLDYFPEKPWFRTQELVMIDVGKGDHLYLNIPHMTLPYP